MSEKKENESVPRDISHLESDIYDIAKACAHAERLNRDPRPAIADIVVKIFDAAYRQGAQEKA